MVAAIQFNGLEGFEHHRELIEKMIKSGISKFGHQNDNIETRVVLKKTKAKRNFSKPEFECEIILHMDSVRGKLFFRKSSANFYESIKNAFKAAEKSLRRESKIHSTSRKQRWNCYEIENRAAASAV
jgi:ribosome-associated translation inhibitor RaiA